jgi:hypothetical protein
LFLSELLKRLLRRADKESDSIRLFITVQANITMSVTGKIVNGLVVLPPGIKLPEGAVVKIETLEFNMEDDPLVAAVERLAKNRPHQGLTLI